MHTARKTTAPQYEESGHLPTTFADILGTETRNRKEESECKSQGIYLTPVEIASYMANLATVEKEEIVVLDPSAGAGILLAALVERYVKNNVSKIQMHAYETDKELFNVLEKTCKYLASWAQAKGACITYTLYNTDFIIECGEISSQKQKYDIVIANPPYFKLNKSDQRAKICDRIVYGQPNIYSFFMMISAEMLTNEGELIFITPRSFASGSYFKKFRKEFLNSVKIKEFHTFVSRKDSFKRNNVLQETIITKATKHQNSQGTILITSINTSNLNDISSINIPYSTAVNMNHAEQHILLPVTDDDLRIIKLVQSWSNSLDKMRLKISTGPVVAFRAKEFLSNSEDGCVPLLWLNNVRTMEVLWPINKRYNYISNSNKSRKLLVENKNYVLLRRFSSKDDKRRLVAAPYLNSDNDMQQIGLENHLNYIHSKTSNLTTDLTHGLAAVLSSSILEKFFRIFNGNTQVSASEMLTLPLPDQGLIEDIGEKIFNNKLKLADVDNLLNDE